MGRVSDATPVLQVIVGSTRPGRVGLPVATWIAESAEKHGGFTVELVDLAAVDLPVFDEPAHPRLRRYTHAHTSAFSATVDRADGYVFVTPEYNHSFNAATKNALDYLSQEWADKPAGLVTYGGVSGGLRAAQALKPVFTALRMTPLNESVVIPFVQQFLRGEGDQRVFAPSPELESGATAMFDALVHGVAVGRFARSRRG